MKHSKFTRVLSAILCLAMLLPCLPQISLPTKAAAEAGTTAVVTTDTITEDGIDYTVKRTTQYIGNRTYSVQMDISANLSTYENTRVRIFSHNGYVTIQETGYYLLELWGGRGGDGEDSANWSAVIPVPTPGGTGGSGGYVFGKVFLEAGQTLVYNIGTHGDQSTELDDDGGGVNGDGGTHGENGYYTVGGGGGYTAVYLFEPGEFRESYVTTTSINIPETARLSRYLMIAGGGGGGGAGVGGGWAALAANDTPINAPNGGSGGNVNRGASMTVSGGNFSVAGYLFSGRNGTSSGQSTQHIGRGGSNVPGTISETWFGQFSQSKLPNDWTGTANENAAPGAGGTGNFRGGGGGSGYAGGSGGLMDAAAIAANIGGGGGGSSFIAAEVNGRPIEFLNLGNDVTKYLSGAGNQPEGSATGGAMQLTYLSSAEDEFYASALDAVTLSCNIPRYFDILDASTTTGSAALSKTVQSDDSSTDVVASGLQIVPTSPASAGVVASVRLFLKAKEDFMGGNSVPLIGDVSVDFLSPNDNATPINITPTANTNNSFVNVPIKGKMRTHSYTTSDKTRTFATSTLYEDDYASVRSNLTSYWQYDYISAISAYSVTQNGAAAPNPIKPNEGANVFDVSYTVTPKYTADAQVTVGPAIGAAYAVTGKATITLVDAGVAELNGLTVTGTKEVAYADGVYTFSNIIDQQSKDLPVNAEPQSFSVAGSSVWVAPEDGWYCVQAWGGNGGSGGRATITWRYTSWFSTKEGSDYASGGSGGKGGYASTYVYLTAGETISYTIGAVGSSGAGDSDHITSSGAWGSARGNGGTGGGATTLTLGSDTLLIAGGGGGGGGGAINGKTKGTSSGLESAIGSGPRKGTGGTGGTPGTPSTTNSGTHSGGTGGNGTTSGSTGSSSRATGGSGGTAGTSYRNASYGTTQDGYTLSAAAQKYVTDKLTTTKSVTCGQVTITLIENAAMISAQETIKGLQTDVAFSKYFDLDSVDLAVGTAYTSKDPVTNADGSITVTYTSSTYGQVARFTYQVSTAADGSTVVRVWDCDYLLDSVYTKLDSGYSLVYTAHLDFTYTLTPKAGFLGGNDVPLLSYGNTGGVADKDTLPDCGVQIRQGEDFMNLPAIDPTDYVNVACDAELASRLTVSDTTIHLGDSIQKAQLFTFDAPTYGANAWEDDFAYFQGPQNATLSPTQTTDYPITATFVPRTQPAQKATIVESLPTQEQSLVATVYVEVPVTTQLTNLSCDAPQWTLWGESFGCTLTPADGYLLPESVSVTVGGVQITNFTYNAELGTVTLPAEAVTGPIVISADAKLQTYDIFVQYMYYDTETNTVLQKTASSNGILAGDTIDWTFLDEIAAQMPARPGYTYQWVFDADWDYETEGNRPLTMPAKDLWVYGDFDKASYLLTIHYVYADGVTPVAEDHTEYVSYEDAYTVQSPIVAGYLPDTAVVTGTMGAQNLELTVTYTASVNQVLILYQKADGTVIDQVTHDVATDEVYSFPSPQVTGYTPDIAAVEGTMTSDASITYVVTYHPNTYEVTFRYQGEGFEAATMDGDNPRIVEYDNIFGYNAGLETPAFEGMPTPQIAGYTFAGWYTDEACTDGNLVTDTTRVQLTENTTLYAKWKETTFKLTIRYHLIHEEADDFLPKTYEELTTVDLKTAVYELPYNESYSIALPVVEGYSAYSNYGLADESKLTVLSGTMPGQNQLVVLTYTINIYEIRFMDSPSTVTYSDVGQEIEDPSNFATVWQTVYVKHDRAPAFTEAAPTHGVSEQYTYGFEGWLDSGSGNSYAGAAPAFDKIYFARDYYAQYTATENLAVVTYGSSTAYFTNVTQALAFAEGKLSNGNASLRFRRNQGNLQEQLLSEGLLTLGNTYTGTTVYPLTLDLGGVTLKCQGQNLVNNTAAYIDLTIQDSRSGEGIQVTGEGDVIAIDSANYGLTLGSNVKVNATSAAGNATAVRFITGSSAYSLTMDASAQVKADAPAGNATAVHLANSASLVPTAEDGGLSVTLGVLTASGNTAIGFAMDAGTFASLAGSGLQLQVAGVSSATGILVPAGAVLDAPNAMTNAQTVQATQGEAVGILNQGSLTALNLKMNVEGLSSAYGLKNEGGSITVTGIGNSTDLRAVATAGAAYGLYSAAGSPAIGAEEGDMLSSGAWAGNSADASTALSYGIYSADGNIYATSGTLYFKGDTEENNLDGVVYTKLEETDATKQFEDGYYRLAARHEIKFETNGGTALDTISQPYDTKLDSEKFVTTRRGYDFVAWYTDEDLTEEFPVPEYMPDEDLTLYAKWDLLTYEYTLDREIKDFTVNFFASETDTVPFQSSVVTKESPTFTPPADRSYASSRYLYIHTGWYTSDGTYVPMHGDISEYVDETGVLNLYPRFNKSSGSNTYQLYSNSSFAPMGTNSNPTRYSLSSSYSSRQYMYMLYYVVEVDGNYTLTIQNHGSYAKYYYVFTYKSTNTSTYNGASGSYSLSSGSKTTYTASGLKAGDAIAIGFYRSNSASSVSCYVSSTPDLTPLESVPGIDISEDILEYNVEMGDYALPIATAPGNFVQPLAEGVDYTQLKFAGWADYHNAAPEDIITELTPEMVETVEEWKNRETWMLYSQWEERVWTAYQSSGRDFSAFTTAAQATTGSDRAISLRFVAEEAPTTPVTFRFEVGLPAGTILTLVDNSGDIPVYYTHTLSALTTQLDSTLLRRMGASGTFSGLGTDLTLQICYRNAAVTNASERVSLYCGDQVPEVLATYSIASIPSATAALEPASFSYAGAHTVQLNVPGLAGLNSSSKVFLRVRWEDLDMAPGALFTYNGYTAQVYDGRYALLDAGLTVTNFATAKTGTLTIQLPTMVQNEFSDKRFTYELCVSDSGSIGYGAGTQVVWSATQQLTLLPTASLSVTADIMQTVSLGQALTIDGISQADASIYLYQQAENGAFVCTAGCASVFSDVTVDENGLLSVADGSLITDGVFTATVSDSATADTYYLVIVYGDKYERIKLKLKP